jgi:hypothetical protein
MHHDVHPLDHHINVVLMFNPSFIDRNRRGIEAGGPAGLDRTGPRD